MASHHNVRGCETSRNRWPIFGARNSDELGNPVSSILSHSNRITFWNAARFVSDKSCVSTRSVVHRCLQSKAPKYLTDCCIPVIDIANLRDLRSASRHHLSVPPYRLGRRAFSVAGLTVWNSLSDSLREPALSSSCFRQLLKPDLYSAHSAQLVMVCPVWLCAI